MNNRVKAIWFWPYAFLLAAFLTLPPAAQAAELPDFARLVEQYGPAVVNISTTQTIRGRVMGPDMDLPEGTPFDDFFRHFFGIPNGGAPREFKAQSLGSGFIISPDGYVVTNAHVVKNADKIVVRLTDRREFEAKVIGKDERTDIALLKIPGQALPVVKIGDPSRLKVGAWVAAIGAPFGFENSVTAGIVGAKGRSLPNESYVPFIQTDVAINPGNSGGPLFNMDGEVVGVNSQIYSRTGGFMGLSFAIPIDVAMQVVNQLRSTGKVSHGWLGVMIQEVTRPLAESFKMSNPNGALVGDVVPNGPAAKAGIRQGDVIVAINGKAINTSGDLPPIVGMMPVGSRAELTVIRDGKPVKVTVVIEELPKEPAALASGNLQSDRLGLTVGPLPQALRQRLRVEGGVQVLKVTEGPAADAGFRPGDVILAIAQQPVAGLEQFRRLVASLPVGQPVPVLVKRGSGSLYLALRLDK
ncbi:MAG: DegQ family serine endoprotease [Pseudomonadota bacterium]